MKNRTSKITSFLLPTYADMFWMVAFFGVLIFGRRMMNADGDFALHLSMGRYILDHRTIPLQDVFSHTMPGQLAIQHKWLAQLAFALAERLLGYGGVVLLCALVIATAFWLVFTRVRPESRSLVTVIFILLLVMAASVIHWLIRPHVFTFLFLAAWLLALDQLRKGKLHLWWLFPLMMLLWVNLHGGFIAGLITWAIFGLGVGWDVLWGKIPSEKMLPVKFWRYYLLGGVTALGASLINPSGIGLWKLILFHLGNKYLADITDEFMSPNFHEYDYWPFLILIGLLVIFAYLNERKIESGLLFNAVAWLFMGLYSVRNIPLFGIVAAPLLVQGMDDLFSNATARFKCVAWLKGVDDRQKQLNDQLRGYLFPVLSVLLAVVGIAMGFRIDVQQQGYDFDPKAFPVKAVDWLEENPQEGEMFNSFMWGGYLQYRLWPEKRVFIDSNSDFYGEAFVRQYMQVITLEDGWECVLDQYDVTWAILPIEMRVASAAQRELGWSIVYQDDTAVILRKE